MFDFFKKKKIHPASEENKPPVKIQNFIRKDTPETTVNQETSTSYSNSASQEETFKEKLYLYSHTQTQPLFINDLIESGRKGIIANDFYSTEKEAYEAAKLTLHGKEFVVFELELDLDNLSVNKNKVEICNFDALACLTNTKTFSANAQFNDGATVNPSKIILNSYVIIAGDTDSVLQQAKVVSNGEPLQLYKNPQQAFVEARKTYPQHALTLLSLQTPINDVDILQSNLNNLNYLLRSTTTITSFGQSSKHFDESKHLILDTIKENAPTPPRMKK
jgi:hypothetical protein